MSIKTCIVNIKNESVFGDYECKATNTYGTLERVVVLEMVSKPQPPTFKVKAVRSTHVYLEIYDYEMVADQGLDRSGPMYLEVTGHKIQYKTEKQEWNKAQEMIVDKGDFFNSFV
ncbi:hypothetical protein QYM36_012986 [Artemia franciscana]|uniref:Uncharacterized protein n=1 Tax=Artemia franciscana TaxID=6661 RepID=A0AA88L5Y6_ARTSF|nr:hypothetical protein QYM36_012986 [Artemia franciscana]